MHDIRWIKDNPQAFDKAMARRGADYRASPLIALDEERVANTRAMNEAQAAQKAKSKEIGKAKASGDEAAAEAVMAEVAGLKEEVRRLEARDRELTEKLRAELLPIPNILDETVPEGADEDENVELKREGTPPVIEAPRDHVDLGEALGMMDFEAAAKISGARFVVLKRDLAKLERALAIFMLNLHTEEFGYEEVAPPVLTLDEALVGTGQLPKFGEDLFSAKPGQLERREALEVGWNIIRGQASFLNTFASDMDALARLASAEPDTVLHQKISEAAHQARLAEKKHLNELRPYEQERDELSELDLRSRRMAPTAEVTLTNLVRESILSEDELPKRMTAWTQCFRAEAGSAGRDTRGMIRMHQFSKVELVSITTPEKSVEEHERMTGCAEAVLKRLELPFRTMLLCSGDTGFSAARTYDIEVWLPAQDRYREISSCSNCHDFQARRMDARYRPAGEKKPRFVHTLNGSGLAVGRTLVAVLENYQQKDGTIRVPDVLVPLMGKDVIGAKV